MGSKREADPELAIRLFSAHFMAPSHLVRILDVIQVSPASHSPDSPTDFSLPLTAFDVIWLKIRHTTQVFFYHLNDSTLASFESVILPKLQRSLSLTLHHYLPLAGRLTWYPSDPKPTIVYAPNDTVTLTIAESTADFTRLSGNGILEAVELHPLVPEPSVSDHAASIISLQITLFPGRGFCIGIAAHHAVLDGQTTAMFLKAWAYICKQDQENPSLPPQLLPSFDRRQIKDQAGHEMAFLNWWLARDGADLQPTKRNLKPFPNPIGADVVRATFDLTREDIKKLREKVLENELIKKHSKSLHLSNFVLTYAYAFTCMIKARGGDENRAACLMLSANYRTRLDPPLPLNYFGNCVGLHFCFATAGDFKGRNGFAIAAEKLSDLVSELGMEALARTPTDFSKFMAKEPGKQTGSVAMSPQFGFYELNFGWGRPRKVDVVSIDRTGAFALAESRDGSEGVEFGLALKRHEMEIFTSLFADGLKDLLRHSHPYAPLSKDQN